MSYAGFLLLSSIPYMLACFRFQLITIFRPDTRTIRSPPRGFVEPRVLRGI